MKTNRIRVTNPTDQKYPDPRGLQGWQAQLWRETYNNALQHYMNVDADPTEAYRRADALAKNTAWKAVLHRTRMMQQQMNPSGMSTGVLEAPPEMIGIGKLIEIVSVEEAPDLSIWRPNADVDLLGSKSRRLLLVLPQAEMSACQTPNPHAEGTKDFEMWARRKPNCTRTLEAPQYPLQYIGPADTVVYRSSKWTPVPGDPEDSIEYIHQFGEGVGLETSPDGAAIVMRGGDMEIHPAGIVN